MLSENIKKRDPVFTAEWIKKNSQVVLAAIQSGYHIETALSMAPDPILPMDWMRVKYGAREGRPQLTESEIKFYHLVQAAFGIKSKHLETMMAKIPIKVGRPTKKSPKIIGLLVEGLRSGLQVHAACAYAGIAPATFYNWAEADQEFLDTITAARLYYKARLELLAAQGAFRDLSGDQAINILGRLDHEQWGRKTNIKGGEDIGYKAKHGAVASALDEINDTAKLVEKAPQPKPKVKKSKAKKGAKVKGGAKKAKKIKEA